LSVKRGDIYEVDLEPTKGREQRGRRPVLIVSPAAFNKHNPPVIVPITSGGDYARNAGFTVSLVGAGTRTTGVILCHAMRALDLKARGAKRVEAAPDYIIIEVLDALADVLECCQS
jgi:mRNA interferase ChpB